MLWPGRSGSAIFHKASFRSVCGKRAFESCREPVGRRANAMPFYVQSQTYFTHNRKLNIAWAPPGAPFRFSACHLGFASILPKTESNGGRKGINVHPKRNRFFRSVLLRASFGISEESGAAGRRNADNNPPQPSARTYDKRRWI